MRKQKVMVFIDGSNFYHDLKKNFGTGSIDFIKFIDFIVGQNKLVAVKYYNSPIFQSLNPEAYSKQQKFLDYLSKLPKFDVKLGRLEKRGNNHFVEKGVDVNLAIDILTHAYAKTYDIGILVSGDADFVPAILAAQDFGRKFSNVCFPKTKSYHLSKICNETITIDKKEFKEME